MMVAGDGTPSFDPGARPPRGVTVAIIERHADVVDC
jgi:hypothetical protein